MRGINRGEPTRLATAIAAALLGPAAHAGTTLPIPCVASACTNSKFGASGFVSAGHATAVQAGSKLTVNQTSNSATLKHRSHSAQVRSPWLMFRLLVKANQGLSTL